VGNTWASASDTGRLHESSSSHGCNTRGNLVGEARASIFLSWRRHHCCRVVLKRQSAKALICEPRDIQWSSDSICPRRRLADRQSRLQIVPVLFCTTFKSLKTRFLFAVVGFYTQLRGARCPANPQPPPTATLELPFDCYRHRQEASDSPLSELLRTLEQAPPPPTSSPRWPNLSHW
jgi:hypothetical protein